MARSIATRSKPRGSAELTRADAFFQQAAFIDDEAVFFDLGAQFGQKFLVTIFGDGFHVEAIVRWIESNRFAMDLPRELIAARQTGLMPFHVMRNPALRLARMMPCLRHHHDGSGAFIMSFCHWKTLNEERRQRLKNFG